MRVGKGSGVARRLPPSPKPGWRRNTVENELGAMPGSFLSGRRIGTLETLRTQITT